VFVDRNLFCVSDACVKLL